MLHKADPALTLQISGYSNPERQREWVQNAQYQSFTKSAFANRLRIRGGPRGAAKGKDSEGSHYQRADADYVLACKGNQERIHTDVEQLFTTLCSTEQPAGVLDYIKMTSEGHGRREVREVWTTAHLEALRDRERWNKLQSVVCVRSERTTAGETTVETRFYLSSATSNAERLANAIRSHWGVENQVHWVLDVVFADDTSPVRIDHSAHNLAIIRHIVLNMLRQETTLKSSLRQKRLRAGWDDNYLLNVLQINPGRVEQM